MRRSIEGVVGPGCGTKRGRTRYSRPVGEPARAVAALREGKTGGGPCEPSPRACSGRTCDSRPAVGRPAVGRPVVGRPAFVRLAFVRPAWGITGGPGEADASVRCISLLRRGSTEPPGAMASVSETCRVRTRCTASHRLGAGSTKTTVLCRAARAARAAAGSVNGSPHALGERTTIVSPVRVKTESDTFDTREREQGLPAESFGCRRDRGPSFICTAARTSAPRLLRLPASLRLQTAYYVAKKMSTVQKYDLRKKNSMRREKSRRRPPGAKRGVWRYRD